MDEDQKTLAARALGMKTSEILNVEDLDDGGMVVVTHDEHEWLVSGDGIYVGPCTGTAAVVDEPDQGPVTSPATELAQEQGGGDGGDGGGGGDGQGADEVPEGSAAEVLTWVDGDADRAARALAAEQGREKPRTSLVTQLEKLQQP